MGCRILSGRAGACFYCSVTDVVFGPLIPCKEDAEEFMSWLGLDPRQYDVDELRTLFKKFREELGK